SSTSLTDPPTSSALASARSTLSAQETRLSTLSGQITAAEASLAQVIADSQCQISLLQKDKDSIESQVRQLQAYLAPIRRLPEELLREVFYWAFDAHPCAAWVLSAVSRSWRRLAISMPRIWSRVSGQYLILRTNSFKNALLRF